MAALFWILKPEDQAKLMSYQYENYGTHLTIPQDPFQPITLDSKLETLEEIDREMRKAPHLPRRVA